MDSNKIKFVVGANPELGGQKIRLMALSRNDKIIQLDFSDVLTMPSAFEYDRASNILYVTDELNDGKGKLATFLVSGNKLLLLQIIETRGSNPCHVSVDKKKNLIFVSHYSSGGIICYRLLKNGLIDDPPLFAMEEHKSFHCVLPLTNGFIALNNINNEMIHSTYSSEQLKYDSITVKIPSPRQAKCYDNNKVFVVSEDESMIYIYDTGTRMIIQNTYACVGRTSVNKAASIWLSSNNKIIMVSNRGEDSLVAFDIEKNNYNILKNPRALLLGGSKCPRDFDIDYDEKYAVVGFTESNCVTVYRINKSMTKADCVASIELTAPIGMQIV